MKFFRDGNRCWTWGWRGECSAVIITSVVHLDREQGWRIHVDSQQATYDGYEPLIWIWQVLRVIWVVWSVPADLDYIQLFRWTGADRRVVGTVSTVSLQTFLFTNYFLLKLGIDESVQWSLWNIFVVHGSKGRGSWIYFSCYFCHERAYDRMLIYYGLEWLTWLEQCAFVRT